MKIGARIEGLVRGHLRGWALDEAHPWQPLELILQADGKPILQMRADRVRGDLRQRFGADGAHGFECSLPLALQDGEVHRFTLRLAADPLGQDLAAAELRLPRVEHLMQGKLERLAERQLVGWVWDAAQPEATVTVELLQAGKVLATARADRLRQDLLRARIGTGRHGFAFRLDPWQLHDLAGTQVTVRAGADHAHWPIGRLTLPDNAGAPPQPAPGEAAPALGDLLAQAREAERRRDFTGAAALLDQALEGAPQDPELHMLRARVAMGVEDFATATRHSQFLERLRPEDPRGPFLLARIATAEGRHAEAVALWERIGPGQEFYRERLLKRGRGLMALGRPAEALREFARATRLDRRNLDALRGAAQAAEGMGAIGAARRHWLRYLEVAPDDALARQRAEVLHPRRQLGPHLPSLLKDAWLHHWPTGIEGEAGRGWSQATRGLRLRGLGGAVRFTAAAPLFLAQEELSCFGVRLQAPHGAELRFLLAAEAAALLVGGLRLGLELACAGGAGWRFVLGLATADEKVRPLLEGTLDTRRRLLQAELELSAEETGALASETAEISLALEGGDWAVVYPPRPLSGLRRERPACAGTAEDPVAQAGLTALRGLAQPA